MTALLIIILFTLALFHWAYEAIIAPSIRVGLRYKLFALRDELRTFSAQHGFQLDYAAIQLFEESINSAIAYMRELNFGLLVAFNKRCSVDTSFRERVEHRYSVIASYSDPEFQALRQRYGIIFREITMVNSGGWFVYIVPVVAIALFWKTLHRMLIKLSVVSRDDLPGLSRGLGEACAEPA